MNARQSCTEFPDTPGEDADYDMAKENNANDADNALTVETLLQHVADKFKDGAFSVAKFDNSSGYEGIAIQKNDKKKNALWFNLNFNEIMTLLRQRLLLLNEKDKAGLVAAVAQYVDARVCHAMLTDKPNELIQKCIDEDLNYAPEPYNSKRNIELMLELFFTHVMAVEGKRKAGSRKESLDELAAQKDLHMQNIKLLL
jgi:hypothetical protein